MSASEGIRHNPAIVVSFERAWCNAEATQIRMGWQSHVKVEKTFRAREIQILLWIPLLLCKLWSGSQLWRQDGVRQILFFFQKARSVWNRHMLQGTFTLQEPWNDWIRQVPVGVRRGMVILHDCHCRKTSSPDMKNAEGQLFEEEVV